MEDTSPILFVTGTPEFIDAGEHLLCRLTSGGQTQSFRISWRDTALAMRLCGRVLSEHWRKESNVLPIRGKPGH